MKTQKMKAYIQLDEGCTRKWEDVKVKQGFFKDRKEVVSFCIKLASIFNCQIRLTIPKENNEIVSDQLAQKEASLLSASYF